MQNTTDDYGHLKTRPQNFLKDALIDFHQINEKERTKFNKFLFTSECDLGVSLNGGRRGAKHGPKAIMHTLGKFQTYKDGFQVLCRSLLAANDNDSLTAKQSKQIKLIEETLKQTKWENIVHLGGGHDQIYPLLSALTNGLQKGPEEKQRLICLNIDAHLDTRTDTQFHSGTPFRQWMDEIKQKHQHKLSSIHFYQFGIHQQSNHPSNYQLDNMHVSEYSIQNIEQQVQDFLQKVKDLNLSESDIIVLSLDCDVFDAAEFPAVSAPNGLGLHIKDFWTVLNVIKDIKCRKAFGIYEYNPLFDDLAVSCARKLAFQIEKFLK